MIRIERTYDKELIKSVIFHPEIISATADDGTSVEQARNGIDSAVENKNVYFLACYDDAELLGVFILIPVNSVTWDVHTNFLPNHRGKKALAAAQLGREWMFRETACKKLITWVPAFNRAAYLFAKRGGMKLEGNNRKSFMKNGVLYDQCLLGICKE